jgi:hypothetical protein
MLIDCAAKAQAGFEELGGIRFRSRLRGRGKGYDGSSPCREYTA